MRTACMAGSRRRHPLLSAVAVDVYVQCVLMREASHAVAAPPSRIAWPRRRCHPQDFFNHVLEQHARLYPGIELAEIVMVRACHHGTACFRYWLCRAAQSMQSVCSVLTARMLFAYVEPIGRTSVLCLQVKRAYLVSTVVHAKWKDFSRTLFPTGFAGATGPRFSTLSPPARPCRQYDF